ncbi:MAG: HDOD domain-containing protein [Treponema sp.]|jgi:HD-like signal output (HDOD) protein|nr:HDOD domain-containing protein [Treponema sp.]
MNKLGLIESYIREMPSLPVSVKKVLEICNNSGCNPSDLNQVISLDPVLTGGLLKLINSAYYGLSSHITSLVKAITMLGINTVKNLVLASAVLGTLPKNKGISGLNMEGYWRHCLCVGVTSKLLAAKQGIDPKYHQEYFTAGLMHDIGKIPLNAVFGEEYVNAVAAADRENKRLVVSENEIFGINHCMSGQIISDMWKLDSSIKDAIVWHHSLKEYSGENSKILCTVTIANYFAVAYEVGFSGYRKPKKLDNFVWETIGLNDDVFEILKDRVYQEIEKAQIFLNI